MNDSLPPIDPASPLSNPNSQTILTPSSAANSSIANPTATPSFSTYGTHQPFQPLPLHGRQQHHFKLILRSLPLIIMVVVALAGSWQIKQVREFFGQASGEQVKMLYVDTGFVMGSMPRPWRNLAQGGEDHNWRMAPILPQVKALNPQYIRLDHIYDFYDIVQGSPGNITFDFSKFDGIIDDVLATGAKPYISLSYMPPAISSGDIIAAPVRWEDWQETIRQTIQHISGERKIADVYYEVWNEPDLYGGWHYGKKDKNYMTLYNYAARGEAQARSVPGIQPYKFGGPAITALYKNWFNAMCRNAVENNVRFDFMSWHRYTMDVDQYKSDIADAHNWLQEWPQLQPTLELHITEWGHDSNNHPGYDNEFAAAHTVASSIEMINVLDRAFVFEIQDGKGPEDKEFWGRWGMFTHQDKGSKPKPRYQGLRMLDRISDQRIQVLGKGSWVKAVAAKKDDGTVEVVMVNYDSAQRNSETVPITFQNVEPGNYVVSREYLGGRKQTDNVSTTTSDLVTQVAMPTNSVVFVEVKRGP